MTPTQLSWRKTTDVNREFALFELKDDDSILLDVGFSDNGILEVGHLEEPMDFGVGKAVPGAEA